MPISPRIEELFNEAITLSPDDRDRFLKQACGDDQALYDEVSSLLTAANESEAFFDGLSNKVGLSALAEDDSSTFIEKRLGQWRLVSLLGRGGMGAVYLAERADGEFEKRVAVKTLSIGLDSHVAKERFINERQILARLVHDNIARLLDGGVSDDGTPYFVMDYVDGVRIDEYCRRHQCSVRQAVDLVLEVSNGVQYAHRNLVIHRDLKPTNILVDHFGYPRLLDFGIAKVLESDQDVALTQIAQRPVTPAYASPEMLRGEAVDVTTDVYSIGVVLYQLLTGVLPIDVEGLSLAELHAKVSRQSPKPARHCNDLIDTDLDAILSRALAKDPADRYASMESLASDLRHWREGMPVSAKSPSWFYRARKFVGRNVTAVALSTVAIVSLAGFALFASLSAARSEQQRLAVLAERNRLQATQDFLVSIFEAAGPKAEGRTVTAREILESGRERVQQEFTDEPRLRADMMETIAGVYMAMGLNNETQELMYERKTLVAELDGQNSREYFDILMHLAESEDMVGNYAQAEALAYELIDISKVLGDLASQGEAHGRLGRMMHLQGDYEGADLQYREALRLLQQSLGDDDMRTAAAKLNLATLLDHTGSHQEAYDIFLDIEATHKRVKKNKEIVETDLHLGMARSLTNLKRYDEAMAIYQKTMDQNIRLYGPDYTYNLYIANGMSSVAEIRGDYGEALRMQEEARRLIMLHTPDSPNVGRVHLNLGRINQLQDRCESAIPTLREAVEILSDKLPDHFVVGQAKWRLGACLAEFQEDAEAESLLLEGVAILTTHLDDDHRFVMRAREALAAFQARD